MEPEITVGIRSGNLVLSFKTDRAGSNMKEGLEAISHLLSSNKDLLQTLTQSLPVVPAIGLPEEQSAITLSQLRIPTDEKEAILSQIDRVNRFDLFILLLYYAKKPLSYDQIMLLSKELGMPIRYNWLDSEPHRKEHAGLVKSDPIPRRKEKLYSLTERGKKLAESIIERIEKKA